MFAPTRILRDEHDVILRGLHELETCCYLLDNSIPVPAETLEDLLEFFRLYADRTHHGKEEDLLFPAMIARGFQREAGPIACMLHDHENNRLLVREMGEAVADYRRGNKQAIPRFVAVADRYVALLREHIHKENEILFVMAERVFSPADEPELMKMFKHADGEKIGAEEIARLNQILDKVQEGIAVAQ